ncbi:ABC transporter permease [Vibrio sp. RE86]|uniref:ABC transporter permease n=1 Tax=Vibrio sp. RE86 TaxID=2607605 RepID=UPI001493581F|nr:ABC transporter permease [Vibrio sp. RE86]NOH80026.1 ABC transporter permease [Vibrio sp. RE86]
MQVMRYSQFSIIRRDKWLLACLTWLPLLLAWMIWAIFSQGIARDLPIGVVDHSNSTLSQHLVRYYDATPAMKVTEHFASSLEAKQALVEGKVYAYAVIPTKFDSDIYKQNAPQVSVFYNSQMILIGKLLNSAFLQAQGTFNAELMTVSNLAQGGTTLLSATGNAVTVQTQITPLFNKNSNYAQFLVSAIIPALWQISIVVSTILVLTANLRDRGLQSWLGHKPLKSLISTLTPYSLIFALQGFGFLCWFYIGFEWPMNGSFITLVFAQLVTILACMIMGCLFFFLTLDAARAMSFAGAFTAPSFAFMGITFPVTDMNSLAQIWRSLLPVSHYIEVQVSQVSYGQPWLVSIEHLLPTLGYLVPAALTVLLINKHLKTTTLVNAEEKIQ